MIAVGMPKEDRLTVFYPETFMYKLFGISSISQESLDYWDE